MTIDLNFLMFVIALIGCLGGAFAFFTKLLLGIKQDCAKTNEVVVELHSDIKNTKEYHTCEFNRIDGSIDDMDKKLEDHERRIVKLEAKCK